ncbi:MAG: hypothetical protein ABEJ03_03400 [Candidatus Nanohaloarchaea archaeon]
MRKKLSIAVLAIATMGMVSSSAAQITTDAQNETDVNVSIDSTVAVDLHPREIDYTDLSVGTHPLDPENVTDEGYSAVDLENTGSEYIDRIWIDSTKTPGFPWGTGDEANYNAGNFLMVSPSNQSGLLQGSTDEYNYVNRVEYGTYNDTEKPSYINAPDDGTYETTTGTTSANDVATGRFRMGSQEYWWAIPMQSSDQCDGSGTFSTLLVQKQPHNSTSTASVDFTDDASGFDDIPGRDYELYNITSLGSTNYGITETGPTDGEAGVTLEAYRNGQETNRTYDVLTKCDTDSTSGVSATDSIEVIRTRYNVRATGANNLATATGTSGSGAPATQFLLNTDTDSEMLKPGAFVTFDIAMEVPRGVPEGIVNQGTLSVLVRADESAT